MKVIEAFQEERKFFLKENEKTSEKLGKKMNTSLKENQANNQTCEGKSQDLKIEIEAIKENKMRECWRWKVSLNEQKLQRQA